MEEASLKNIICAAQARVLERKSQLLEAQARLPAATRQDLDWIKKRVHKLCLDFDLNARSLLEHLAKKDIPESEALTQLFLLDLECSGCYRTLKQGAAVVLSALEKNRQAQAGGEPSLAEKQMQHLLQELPPVFKQKPGEPARLEPQPPAVLDKPHQPETPSLPEPQAAPVADKPQQPEPGQAAQELARIGFERLEALSREISGRLADTQAALDKLAQAPPPLVHDEAAERAAESQRAKLEAMADALTTRLDAMAHDFAAKSESAQTALRGLSELLEKTLSAPQHAPATPAAPGQRCEETSAVTKELRDILQLACRANETMSIMAHRQELQERLADMTREMEALDAENKQLKQELQALRSDTQSLRDFAKDAQEQLKAMTDLQNTLNTLRRDMEFKERSLQEIMVKQDTSRLEEIFKLRAEVEKLQLKLKIRPNPPKT